MKKYLHLYKDSTALPCTKTNFENTWEGSTPLRTKEVQKAEIKGD